MGAAMGCSLWDYLQGLGDKASSNPTNRSPSPLWAGHQGHREAPLLFCQLSKTTRKLLDLQASCFRSLRTAYLPSGLFAISGLLSFGNSLRVSPISYICKLLSLTCLPLLCLYLLAHSRVRSVSCLRLAALRQLSKSIIDLLAWQVAFANLLYRLILLALCPSRHPLQFVATS